MGVVGLHRTAGDDRAVLNEATLSRHENGASDVSLERHYSRNEVAELWGVSPQTVTRLVADEPGVAFLGHGETRKKRAYQPMRIPESAVIRVHRKLQQVN